MPAWQHFCTSHHAYLPLDNVLSHLALGALAFVQDGSHDVVAQGYDPLCLLLHPLIHCHVALCPHIPACHTNQSLPSMYRKQRASRWLPACMLTHEALAVLSRLRDRQTSCTGACMRSIPWAGCTQGASCRRTLHPSISITVHSGSSMCEEICSRYFRRASSSAAGSFVLQPEQSCPLLHRDLCEGFIAICAEGGRETGCAPLGIPPAIAHTDELFAAPK